VELIFNHLYGRQEQQDLVYTPVWAFAEPEEEAELIESGWLLLDRPYQDRECWYQSRSTRICMNSFRPRFHNHDYNGHPITVREIITRNPADLTLSGIKGIYQQYIKRKNFADLYSPFEYLTARDSFLLYYIDKELVGFTKMRRYNWQEAWMDADDMYLFPDPEDRRFSLAGIESVLHASTLPISALTLDIEIAWAKKNGAADFYMGSGYERGSEYKASYRGFEWWTGTAWSRQKKTYRRLCKRDSEIQFIQDLPSK
jgi:hypothetical protein